MVGDAELLGCFGTVLTDKLLCFDTVTLEELAHGIKVIHWHHIVFRIVEEHHVKVTAGCPATGECICGEGGLESARQRTTGIEDGRCADVTRLFGLDKFLVKGPALVLLAEEPLIEVLGHGILQIVVDVVTQAEEVVEGIEHVADGAGHLGVAFGDCVIHRVDVVGTVAGEGSFHPKNLDFIYFFILLFVFVLFAKCLSLNCRCLSLGADIFLVSKGNEFPPNNKAPNARAIIFLHILKQLLPILKLTSRKLNIH